MLTPPRPAAPATVTFLPAPDYLPFLASRVHLAHKSICASLYMARAPRRTDHDPLSDLWHIIDAAPIRVADCRILLNRCFPRGPTAAYNKDAAARLTAAGWRVRWYSAHELAHAKLWLFDATSALIGSSNLGTSHRHQLINVDTYITACPAIPPLQASFDTEWAAAAGNPHP